ncbi:hypothetical protein [Planctomyces sp. SH-PL14]|uniref:hypothetical protein n=1 Tax=Planctomyces sp. SH-PL14 TaxID=1632864 RepID=UPI00078E7101|nr:hypothetical protein [Planctomyces sp. SH-PL14]AMV18355.1 hypothetical protein VT03_10725 [Planctomyces sp. SH-PL14]
MHESVSWFRWAMVFGFMITNFFAIAGIFAPGAVLTLLDLPLATSPVWPAFAWLLMFLVSCFSIPAAIDPLRHWPTAVFSVLSHFVYAAFWYWQFPALAHRPAPLIWWLEFILGAIQLVLLTLVRRAALTESISPRI